MSYVQIPLMQGRTCHMRTQNKIATGIRGNSHIDVWLTQFYQHYYNHASKAHLYHGDADFVTMLTF